MPKMFKLAASFFLIPTVLLAVFITSTSYVRAGETITIATAANFIRPMEKLLDIFNRQSAVKAQATYGSSGKLFAQINQGAPYDLFLSADTDRPERLSAAGLAETPFHYATGQVVLWSRQAPADKPADWKTWLNNSQGRIGIANPQTAPYGQAAITALEKCGLLTTIKPRLVYGQTVSQAFQYAETGNTEFAFVPLAAGLSESGHRGVYLPVSEAPPILQNGCLLKSSQQSPAAREFIDFLNGPAAAGIKKSFGYR